MIEYVFQVRDIKAEAFGAPWTKNTIEAAQRDFVAACMTEGTPQKMFPEDYTLYCVGTTDFASGVWDIYQDPKQIMTGFEARQVVAQHNAQLMQMAVDVRPGQEDNEDAQ